MVKKMITHMPEDHVDIKKEEYVESRTFAVDICHICKKVLYSEDDLDQHNQVPIHCASCQLCTTPETLDLDFCTAMEHFDD